MTKLMELYDAYSDAQRAHKRPACLRERATMTNETIIRRYRCARCWGALVERFIEGRWIVVCAADPAHAGHVTQASVTAQETLDRLRGSEVMGFYSRMFGIQRPDREAGSKALYGDDEPII